MGSLTVAQTMCPCLEVVLGAAIKMGTLVTLVTITVAQAARLGVTITTMRLPTMIKLLQ
jgi:hypothetical protein